MQNWRLSQNFNKAFAPVAIDEPSLHSRREHSEGNEACMLLPNLLGLEHRLRVAAVGAINRTEH